MVPKTNAAGRQIVRSPLTLVLIGVRHGVKLSVRAVNHLRSRRGERGRVVGTIVALVVCLQRVAWVRYIIKEFWERIPRTYFNCLFFSSFFSFPCSLFYSQLHPSGEKKRRESRKRELVKWNAFALSDASLKPCQLQPRQKQGKENRRRISDWNEPLVCIVSRPHCIFAYYLVSGVRGRGGGHNRL